MKWWFLQKSGRNHRKNNDTKHNKKFHKQEQCDTKHNALKTYLAGEHIFRIPLFQPTRQQVKTKGVPMILEGEKTDKEWWMVDGWRLTAIDRCYCRNSVGLISAKYCSDAKWYTRHGGVIFPPSHSFAEKGKMLPLTYDDGLSGWSFFSPKIMGSPFLSNSLIIFCPRAKKKIPLQRGKLQVIGKWALTLAS